MSHLRQAAQQALEALAIGQDAAHEVAQNYHEAMAGYRPARHIAVDDDVRKIEAAITVLRNALAEPGQEPDIPEANCGDMEQVPVGWLENPFGSFRRNWLWKLDPTPQSLAWSIPLYTSPPQRKPLTETEVYAISDGFRSTYIHGGTMFDSFDALGFARAIEQAHGIKENT